MAMVLKQLGLCVGSKGQRILSASRNRIHRRAAAAQPRAEGKHRVPRRA